MKQTSELRPAFSPNLGLPLVGFDQLELDPEPLQHYVSDRGRRYLQAALIMSALITVIAVPMILLRGTQPVVKALLLRNYGFNLILINAIIAVISLILYTVRVARDQVDTMNIS